MTVRAGHMDTLPKHWANQATDLGHPYVTVGVLDEGRMFTPHPAAARQMAAASTTAANAVQAADRNATQPR